MLQMMKSKQSQSSQVNTLHHQGMSLFGGCCRYTQFWAIFQPCKGFFMAFFDLFITFLGWRQKNVTVLQPEISFLAPALHKSLRLPNVKQVAKQNPLRFGPGLWDSVYGLAWWTNILIYTDGFLGYWQIGNWLWCFRKKINACLHHLITSIHTNQQNLPWFKRSMCIYFDYLPGFCYGPT